MPSTHVVHYNSPASAEKCPEQDMQRINKAVPVQAFGVSQLAVDTHMQGLGTSFIAQGNEAALTKGQGEPPFLAAKAAPLQPPTATKQFHRLPVYTMVAPEVRNCGTVTAPCSCCVNACRLQ